MRDNGWNRTPGGLSAGRDKATFRIVIVGAGFAGIGLAIQLRKAGYSKITILEKSERPGGTWRDNTYPGAACDVPSHLYSFSFAPKHDWRSRFAGQEEILAYLEEIADRFGVRALIRFRSSVIAAAYDDRSGTWIVTDSRGERHTCDAFVTAVGQLSVPALPAFAGIDEFRGAKFHSAARDHSVALRDKRIAVIGSAASAVQIVPELTKIASYIAVFQRTPNWVIPRFNWRYGTVARTIFRYVPFYRWLTRVSIYWFQETLFGALRTGSALNRLVKNLALWHLRRQVRDGQLRARLTPDFELGCKRLLLSDDYFPCFNQPHVELVTEAIERFDAAGIRTTDCKERAFDVVVFATGFDARAGLRSLEILGKDGVDLQKHWSRGPEAYRGMMVPGFPNLFLLYGPNTNLGHNSILFMLECQFAYIVQCLDRIVSRNLHSLEIAASASDTYNRALQHQLSHLVWSSGCSNWYGDKSRNTSNWSGTTTRYWFETRRVRFRHFLERPRRFRSDPSAANEIAVGNVPTDPREPN